MLSHHLYIDNCLIYLLVIYIYYLYYLHNNHICILHIVLISILHNLLFVYIFYLFVLNNNLLDNLHKFLFLYLFFHNFLNRQSLKICIFLLLHLNFFLLKQSYLYIEDNNLDKILHNYLCKSMLHFYRENILLHICHINRPFHCKKYNDFYLYNIFLQIHILLDNQGYIFLFHI